jgi:peptidoglycan/LPS O-acetylase OafA/YrhL
MRGSNHSREENSFDALRLIAAFLVFYSHQWGMLGYEEPGVPQIGQSFGGLGVFMFFGISGFLVARSVLSGKSVADFFAARALRIYPALVVSLLVCLVLGLLLTTVDKGAYLASPATWQFFFGNILPFFQEQALVLPGVFETANWTGVNGSLWTIKYELFCYGVIALAFLVPARRRPLAVGLLAALGFAAYGALARHWPPPEGMARFVYFNSFDARFWGSMFAFGALLAAAEKRWPSAPTNIALATAMVYLALLGRNISYMFPIATVVGLTIAVGVSPLLYSRTLRRFGDVSYGLYLYAYPVCNLVTTYLKDSVPIPVVFAISFLVTLALAFASWWTVERPALALKPRSIRPVQPVATPAAG